MTESTTNQIHGNVHVHGAVIQVGTVNGNVYVGALSSQPVATLDAPVVVPMTTAPVPAGSARLGLRPPTPLALTARASERFQARLDVPVITRAEPSSRQPSSQPRPARREIGIQVSGQRRQRWEPSTLVIALFLFAMLVLFVVARAISISH